MTRRNRTEDQPKRSDSLETAQALLHFEPRAKSKLTVIGGLSLLSGLSEAGVITLVSAAAVATAQSDEVVRLSVASFQPIEALWAALGLLAFNLGIGVYLAHSLAKLSAEASFEARKQIVGAFHRASYQRKSRDRVAALQEVLTTDVDRFATSINSLSMLISASLSTISFGIAAIAVSPFAAVVIAVVGVLLTAVLRPAANLTRQASRSLAQRRRGYAEGATESVLLARELSVFGVSTEADIRLRKIDVGVAAEFRRTSFLLTLAPKAYQTIALACAVVGLMVLNQLEIGNLAAVGAVVLLLVRSLSYAQNILTGLQTMSGHRAYVDRLMEFLSSYNDTAIPHGTRQIGKVDTVEFKNVGFGYDDHTPALADVSLAIKAGETVGIVGPSGAGKSTLVNLLLRLYTPSDGSILVNGIPLHEVADQEWHHRTAIVPQEPRLLHGSVADNIRFLRDFDIGTVERAAAEANIAEFVRTQPEGFDAPVGELGLGLSGGQRQRICIGRALAGDPDLLVLDEPTSALDGDSEAAIQRTLENLQGRVTMVIVAHRLSTLSICDRLVVLRDGRVESVGTPADLIGSSEYYREALRLAGISGDEALTR